MYRVNSTFTEEYIYIYIHIHVLLSGRPKSVRVAESVKRPAKGLMTVVQCQTRAGASVIMRRSARSPNLVMDNDGVLRWG